jgi:hypothetical protein
MLRLGIEDYSQYGDHPGCLPPAFVLGKDGAPAHSWRVLVLKFLDPEVYRRYDFGVRWDSPENLPLLQADPIGRSMACPDDPGAAASRSTSYVAVVGENTLWPGSRGRTPEELVGNRRKILLIELPFSDIRWTEPRDVSFEDALRMYSDYDGFRRMHHPEGLYYLTLDGTLHPFSEIESKEEFARLLQIERRQEP